MKTETRTYRMGARADAVEASRERIARAALARFIAEPYDAVTIASVAKDAGVSTRPSSTTSPPKRACSPRPPSASAPTS